MSEREALIADSTSAMRELICDTLKTVGYHVTGAETAQELAGKVHEQKLLVARTALVVVGAKWTEQCAVPISVAASQRWRLQLPPLKVVVVHEWGTLSTVSHPHLKHCEVIAVLEKPFDLNDLEAIARLALAQVA